MKQPPSITKIDFLIQGNLILPKLKKLKQI